MGSEYCFCNVFWWFLPWLCSFYTCFCWSVLCWILKENKPLADFWSFSLWSSFLPGTFLWSSSCLGSPSDCQLHLLNPVVSPLCLEAFNSNQAVNRGSSYFPLLLEITVPVADVQYLGNCYFIYFVKVLVVSGRRVNPIPIYFGKKRTNVKWNLKFILIF